MIAKDGTQHLIFYKVGKAHFVDPFKAYSGKGESLGAERIGRGSPRDTNISKKFYSFQKLQNISNEAC